MKSTPVIAKARTFLRMTYPEEVDRARCEVVPGCGHSVYFEDAPAFNRVVSEFLQSVEGGGGRK